MDIQNILLFMTAGANIGLAFYIFGKDIKNRINITFSMMLFFIAVWSFAIAIFRTIDNVPELFAWLTSFYISAGLIALTFYYFTHYFPFETKKLKLSTHIVNLISTTAVILIVIYGGVIEQIYFSPDLNHTAKINPINYSVYTVYFCTYMLISFYLLIKKMGRTSSHMKRMIRIVLYSTMLAASMGMIFNLFIPIYTYKYIWIGPYFTMIMVFIIVKYIFIKDYEK